MQGIFRHALRMLCVAFVLAGTHLLAAAFEIAIEGEGFRSLGFAPVTVARQSLESRTDVAVATGHLVDGRLLLRVNSEPGLFNLQVGDRTISFVAAYGQRLGLMLSRDGKNLRIGGGRDQELFMAYEEFRAESLARKVTPVRAAIAVQRAAGNEAEATRLTDVEVVAYQEHRRELNDFTLATLRGSAALYASSLRWDGDYRLDELAEAVKEYARKSPQLEIVRLMEERIQRSRATALGAVAPVLAGSAPAGGRVSLADLRGRYVLVDFWASWCAPCRVENRNYAELYERYRADRFEILAVSVDENGAAWNAAIEKDNARWLHVSDLKGWQSPLAGAYNVAALPASFLLDPEGRIIAKDLRGKQLAARLESLFPQARKVTK
jgi:thiol-disulfide isomerase/thioredoxin